MFTSTFVETSACNTGHTNSMCREHCSAGDCPESLCLPGFYCPEGSSDQLANECGTPGKHTSFRRAILIFLSSFVVRKRRRLLPARISSPHKRVSRVLHRWSFQCFLGSWQFHNSRGPSRESAHPVRRLYAVAALGGADMSGWTLLCGRRTLHLPSRAIRPVFGRQQSGLYWPVSTRVLLPSRHRAGRYSKMFVLVVGFAEVLDVEFVVAVAIVHTQHPCPPGRYGSAVGLQDEQCTGECEAG